MEKNKLKSVFSFLPYTLIVPFLILLYYTFTDHAGKAIGFLEKQGFSSISLKDLDSGQCDPEYYTKGMAFKAKYDSLDVSGSVCIPFVPVSFNFDYHLDKESIDKMNR